MKHLKWSVIMMTLAILMVMGTQDVQADKIFKVGVVLPQTGQLSLEGGHETNGIKMAADEINAQGGIKVGGERYKIELLVYDDGGVPKESIAAMEKLATRDKVNMIIGAFTSSSTFAMMPIAQREKVILCSPNASAAKLTQVNNKWYFRGSSTVAGCVQTVADYAKQLGFRTIAHVAVNDDYGRDCSTQLKEKLKNVGIELTTVEYFDHGTSDFYSVLTKVKGIKPDAIQGIMETKAYSIFVRQAREICPNIPLLDAGAADANQLIKLARESADGLYVFSFGPPLDDPQIKQFVQRYRQKYNSDPMAFTFCGYDVMMMYADALQRAGTVTDSEKIRDALNKTAYPGIMGRRNYDSNNETTLGYWGVGIIKGGKTHFTRVKK